LSAKQLYDGVEEPPNENERLPGITLQDIISYIKKDLTNN
jgi:hypothetical protein